MDAEKTLKDLIDVALKAADPYPATLKNLPNPPEGKLFILSCGKAAGPMAYAAAGKYKGRFDGILMAPAGYMDLVLPFKCFTGGHPLPTSENVRLTNQVVAGVKALGEGDMFLALISGGTSALLCRPLGVTLAEKIRITGELLKSGADIAEINRVRKELSAVKGGKLGKMAHPARVETLLVSDVAGDDPAIIGSAPTGGGKIILKADDMLAAVMNTALKQGISVSNLGGAVTGEAREVAQDHAEIALGYYGKRPHLILSGGETSVTVTGKGTGGRNSEYALALAVALEGASGIYGLSLDSDGHDGTGPHAGARVKPDTLARAEKAGLNPEKSLKNNESGEFFKALDDLITTGPTGTNLNDLRMILMV
jgi:hydroxypyruvate reductase